MEPDLNVSSASLMEMDEDNNNQVQCDTNGGDHTNHNHQVEEAAALAPSNSSQLLLILDKLAGRKRSHPSFDSSSSTNCDDDINEIVNTEMINKSDEIDHDDEEAFECDMSCLREEEDNTAGDDVEEKNEIIALTNAGAACSKRKSSKPCKFEVPLMKKRSHDSIDEVISFTDSSEEYVCCDNMSNYVNTDRVDGMVNAASTNASSQLHVPFSPFSLKRRRGRPSRKDKIEAQFISLVWDSLSRLISDVCYEVDGVRQLPLTNTSDTINSRNTIRNSYCSSPSKFPCSRMDAYPGFLTNLLGDEEEVGETICSKDMLEQMQRNHHQQYHSSRQHHYTTTPYRRSTRGRRPRGRACMSSNNRAIHDSSGIAGGQYQKDGTFRYSSNEINTYSNNNVQGKQQGNQPSQHHHHHQQQPSSRDSDILKKAQLDVLNAFIPLLQLVAGQFNVDTLSNALSSSSAFNSSRNLSLSSSSSKNAVSNDRVGNCDDSRNTTVDTYTNDPQPSLPANLIESFIRPQNRSPSSEQQRPTYDVTNALSSIALNFQQTIATAALAAATQAAAKLASEVSAVQQSSFLPQQRTEQLLTIGNYHSKADIANSDDNKNNKSDLSDIQDKPTSVFKDEPLQNNNNPSFLQSLEDPPCSVVTHQSPNFPIPNIPNCTFPLTRSPPLPTATLINGSDMQPSALSQVSMSPTSPHSEAVVDNKQEPVECFTSPQIMPSVPSVPLELTEHLMKYEACVNRAGSSVPSLTYHTLSDEQFQRYGKSEVGDSGDMRGIMRYKRRASRYGRPRRSTTTTVTRDHYPNFHNQQMFNPPPSLSTFSPQSNLIMMSSSTGNGNKGGFDLTPRRKNPVGRPRGSRGSRHVRRRGAATTERPEFHEAISMLRLNGGDNKIDGGDKHSSYFLG